jgi:predicted DNA-binding antitoxin AbrB/MazE fold protein
MNKQFEAIYENGVFRPVEPVQLPEQQRVRVIVPEDVAAVRNDTDSIPAENQPVADNGLEEAEDARPWRGVLVLPRPRKPLFTKEIPADAAKLPKRSLTVNMNYHRMVPDDE